MLNNVGGVIETFQEQNRATMIGSVFKYYENMRIVPDENGILDVEVSFDGSWLNRGHKSHIGFGGVIEAFTGFVLDFEILSNICIECKRMETKKKKQNLDEAAYESLKKKHEPNCRCNFVGLSGAMEKEGAVRLWKRSEAKNKMRYMVFIGDGDSSAFDAVTRLNDNAGPYTAKIRKEECINHVAKRLGTRLRKLKNETVEVKETKSGKSYKRSLLSGKHKLTDAVIDKLSWYFGLAVRRCKGQTTEILRNDIMAAFDHCSSTDKIPNHARCPKGEGTWCFYQEALYKKETPPSHKKMIVYFNLEEREKEKVLEVYQSLTTDELLGRCLAGKTQNPNEALHSKIWKTLSKTKFFGLKTVQFSATHNILQHNFGYAEGSILPHLGFGGPSSPARHYLKRKDIAREKTAATPKGPRSKRMKKDQPSSEYGAGKF